MIEFRDVRNFTKLSSQTVPFWPMCLTTASPSTLLFSDGATRTIRWFDFSEMKLKDKALPYVKEQFLADISYAHDEYGEFLISANGYGGVFVYNTNTSQLQWFMKGRQPGMKRDLDVGGITSDGRGNLFVCDFANECIEMFSMLDGSYLGSLVIEEQGLGSPRLARFCKEMSSLIVYYYGRSISKVELVYNNDE